MQIVCIIVAVFVGPRVLYACVCVCTQGVTVDESRIKAINQLADRLITQGRTENQGVRHKRDHLNDKYACTNLSSGGEGEGEQGTNVGTVSNKLCPCGPLLHKKHMNQFSVSSAPW